MSQKGVDKAARAAWAAAQELLAALDKLGVEGCAELARCGIDAAARVGAAERLGIVQRVSLLRVLWQAFPLSTTLGIAC